MRAHFFGLVVVISAVLSSASPSAVWAVVPLVAPPVPKRVALADLVVVGKVTAIEDDLVEAPPLLKIPGVSKNVSYRMAVVTIDSALLGGKEGDTRIRIGVLQPAKRAAKVQFKVEQEGCFFLRKHPDESFYVIQEPYELLDKTTTKEFDKEVALAKRSAQLLADPDAGLEAKEADDRLLTAAMLIFQARTPRVVYTKEPKTEPIDAVQSKHILTVLAEADWTERNLPSAMAPLSLFLYLGLTERDGWLPPKDVSALPEAARQWLKKNAAEYRIRRYVAEDKNQK
jgi:hypothetical protein